MNINLKEQLVICAKTERHFKLDIEGKEIWVNKWSEQDSELGILEGDTEIIKGKELLTEDEQEEVIDFVNEL